MSKSFYIVFLCCQEDSWEYNPVWNIIFLAFLLFLSLSDIRSCFHCVGNKRDLCSFIIDTKDKNRINTKIKQSLILLEWNWLRICKNKTHKKVNIKISFQISLIVLLIWSWKSAWVFSLAIPFIFTFFSRWKIHRVSRTICSN